MLKRLLTFLSTFVTRHPWLTAGLYMALAVWTVPAVLKIEFKTDQNDLVGADLEYNRRYLDFLEEFGDLEFLYVVIEVGKDQQAALAAAREIRERVEQLDEHVEWALDRIPAKAMRYGILHREVEELEVLAAALAGNRDLLEKLGQTDRLERLFSFFAGLLDPEEVGRRFASGEDNHIGPGTAGGAVSLLEHSLASTLAALEGRETDSLARRLDAEQGGSLRERGYLATENEKYLLVEILPKKDTGTVELIREPLLEIRKVLADVQRAHPEVELGLTGRPVLQADEMMTTDKDMKKATLVALVGVFALFVIFFRRLGRPLLCILTLSIAILLTFALTALTIGYLTLLSIVFAAMLVGLGIDFGIHFIARYQEELEREGDVEAAVRNTIGTTGRAIVIGGITTAAAFYMTLFVDFKGLRELGFIAGSGVLICLFSMITLLPALIILFDSRAGRKASARTIRVPLLELAGSRPLPVITIAGVMTGAGFFCLAGLPYNPNLLELQNQELKSVQYERLLIEDSDFSTWYAAFIAADIEEARRKQQSLEALDKEVIARTESILDYLPERQLEKLERLKTARSALAGIVIPAATDEVDAKKLGGALELLQGNLFDLADIVAQANEEEGRRFAARLLAAADLSGDLAELLEDGPAEKIARLSPFQRDWITEVNGLLGSLQAAVIETTPISPANLPDILRSRLVSRDGGEFIVYAYANGDLWHEETMRRFIREMRRIDPEVTGAPVQVYESAGRMREGFEKAALYSLGVVFLFLLAELRSLRLTLLAMVPLLVGLLWLLEALPLLELDFNLANFFALPILIGCGVDGGVHIIHRFRESGSVLSVGRTTAAAVTLSFLTTMIGFGAMATASHRGVASLGLMMIIGLLCILAATVILLPALLKLTERK